MFSDDYKNAMDGIRPDGYIKQKVLKKISTDKAKKKASKIVIFRAAAAIAACFCVALSVWITKPFDAPPTNGKAESYDKIFAAVKKFQIKANTATFWDRLTGGITLFNNAEDEIAYEYYSDAEGSVMVNGATAGGSAPSTNAPIDDSVEVEMDAGADGDSYSETTAQVDGVSESDIVKTDGKYIYSLSSENGILRIIKAGKEPQLVSRLSVNEDGFRANGQMYLIKEKLVIIVNGTGSKSETAAFIYDVSKPEKAKKVHECSQSGRYNDSRMIGDKLYLITDYNINTGKIKEEKTETYTPSVYCGNYNGVVKADSVYINENCIQPFYTVICGFDISNGELLGTQSLLGGTYTLYCSTENIITAGYSSDNKTPVSRFSLNDGKVKHVADGSINGTLLNQFSIDEYKGNFRFVTTGTKGVVINGEVSTNYRVANSNSLYVLDGNLKQIGAIEDIAPDERVYSVRFMGDTAYFVTFRQVDPLFSVDLSNPKKPKIIGALKIPGFSNYLFPYGKGNLLGLGMEADEDTGRTSGIKLSMFDISDPSNVTESAKTVLDSDYSDALYNHKAVMVDIKRNLIAFAVYARHGIDYVVYSYNNGEFTRLAQIELGEVYSDVRGLYINEEFYIVTNKTLSVCRLDDFSVITTINIE